MSLRTRRLAKTLQCKGQWMVSVQQRFGRQAEAAIEPSEYEVVAAGGAYADYNIAVYHYSGGSAEELSALIEAAVPMGGELPLIREISDEEWDDKYASFEPRRKFLFGLFPGSEVAYDYLLTLTQMEYVRDTFFNGSMGTVNPSVEDAEDMLRWLGATGWTASSVRRFQLEDAGNEGYRLSVFT